MMMMLARERSLLVEDVVDVLRALLVEQLHVGRAERAFVGAHGWAFSPSGLWGSRPEDAVPGDSSAVVSAFSASISALTA
jgi:hypothetical protein